MYLKKHSIKWAQNKSNKTMYREKKCYANWIFVNFYDFDQIFRRFAVWHCKLKLDEVFFDRMLMVTFILCLSLALYYGCVSKTS